MINENNDFNSKNFFIETYLKNKNKFPNVLYIHSPFCDGKCSYCKYSGLNINNIDHSIIEEYYSNDFVKQINDYKEIFDEVIFDEVYFGGGTVNFCESPAYLEKLISSIPNFNKIKKKSIELHPKNFNANFVNILKKYKFDYVSIGIQSLDEETCNNENRYYCNYDKIKEIINNLKENEFFINIDIILNLKYNDVKNSFKDYEKILDLSPNSICIQPNCAYDYSKIEFIDIYNLITKILNKYKNYALINEKLDVKNFVDDYEFHKKYGVEYRLVDVNKDIYMHYIYSKKKSNDFYNYNVLGMGYVPNMISNHAVSFSGDIFYDSSDETIFTLSKEEKQSTIISQQLLRDIALKYNKEYVHNE